MGKAEKQMYAQCTYERKTETGIQKGVAWIPLELAKVGKKIYLGEKRKVEESEKWTVTSVGAKKSGKWLIDKQNADKHQREASDV